MTWAIIWCRWRASRKTAKMRTSHWSLWWRTSGSTTWPRTSRCEKCRDRGRFRLTWHGWRERSKCPMMSSSKISKRKINGLRSRKRWYSLRSTWKTEKRKNSSKIMKLIWRHVLTGRDKKMHRIRNGINIIGTSIINSLISRRNTSRNMCCQWRRGNRESKRELWRN